MFMLKTILKIRNFDSWVGSTSIYRVIDSVCNILLVFSLFMLVILAFAHQVQILNALN